MDLPSCGFRVVSKRPQLPLNALVVWESTLAHYGRDGHSQGWVSKIQSQNSGRLDQSAIVESIVVVVGVIVDDFVFHEVVWLRITLASLS